MSDFQGQLAVITGAASGIGRALAGAASARGMNLLLADADGDNLQQVAAELERSGHRVLAKTTDVTDESQMQALAALAQREFGDINLLFNNAGVCPMGMTWDTTASQWQGALQVNVMGVVYGQAAFLPAMMSQAGPARIINTGSVAGLSSNPGGVAYAVTKHAVVALSEGLFMDLQVSGSKVAVSVICPGFVDTNLGLNSPVAQEGETPASVTEGRAALRRTLSQGMPADELADKVFAEIAAGSFWIFTQPEALAGFDLRCESIRKRSDPSFVPMLS